METVIKKIDAESIDQAKTILLSGGVIGSEQAAFDSLYTFYRIFRVFATFRFCRFRPGFLGRVFVFLFWVCVLVLVNPRPDQPLKGQSKRGFLEPYNPIFPSVPTTV